MSSPDEVLDFWFGPLDADGFCVEDRDRLWFRGGRETDERIRERFATLLEPARRGDLDDWAATPRGRLALIILLDQFTRNIHRGSAAAFGGDAHALQLARAGVERGHDRQLAPIERTFFYLPFEHAEDLATQNHCVALFRALQAELPEPLRPRVQSALDYAIQHRDIIARFGRFPHRNRALGRTSTPAERDYLEDASTFGQ
jgi:uncharacterized protein (DUF924 family)